MTYREQLLALTAAAALMALPGVALAQGTTPRTNDASGGVLAQTTPPANTATPRDGTPGNPPGTAATRATDRALGTNMSGAHPENETNRTATSATTSRSTGAASSATSTGATSATMAVDSSTLHNGRRASKLIGSSVYNENNESIGEVDDILIPPGGTSPVAVLSIGGFLGIGAKLVAVPYDRLQMGGTGGDRWTLSGATKDSLTGLPSFTYDAMNDRRG